MAVLGHHTELTPVFKITRPYMKYLYEISLRSNVTFMAYLPLK